MQTFKEEKSIIIPVLIGIGHLIWFYFLSRVFYNNNMLFKINNVTWDNILNKFADDYLVMLLLPTLIIIFSRKNLRDYKLNYNSKITIHVLAVILIVFFFLHNDYSITGVYKFFFYLVVVSFAEEFIYRGYIYNRLKEKSKIKAIIISGVLWGVGHAILPSMLNNSDIFKGMLYEIGVGIIIGWYFIYLQERSGTLWIPIIIHAMLDYTYLFFGQLIAVIMLIYFIKSSKYLPVKNNKN